MRRKYPEALSVFKDAYMLEFLDLPPAHADADLRRALLIKLKCSRSQFAVHRELTAT